MRRSVEHLPRIYFTVSVKTIKREPPINRASPRDYECLHLPRQTRERERERRAFLERKNLEYDRFFWKAKSRFGNVSKNFHAKFRAPACVRILCATREGGSRPRRRRSTAPRTCFTRAHFGIDAGSKGIVQCLQSAGDRDG